MLDNLNSFKFEKLEIGNVKPTNCFTAGSAQETKTADFERKAYILYYTTDNKLENVVGYVDYYTGKSSEVIIQVSKSISSTKRSFVGEGI